uniref:WH2 domain-containing protein n=1 Tax=Macrostomum lignano TaxID=282301 RepID=A0A1I8FNJ4_9PLAT
MTSAARTQLAPREHWSTDALATEDSSAVAKPKAKPAGRSHSFASRLRRAIIGGGRRPVSTDRGGGGGGELPATSGLPSKQQPDVGGRVSGGGGLSGSLRRLLSAKSSNPVSRPQRLEQRRDSVTCEASKTFRN